MNKNPFVPTPSYPHPQPPLPPVAPPSQPQGTDYSAYWAASAAHQQQQAGQVSGQPTYNPQWPAGATPAWSGASSAPATPAKPSAEQSALYANYGYGGQQNLHWQQQHHQQHHQQHGQHQHHYGQPPAPAAHPPAAPPQQQYTPYQPQAVAAPASFQQPYVPQPGGVAAQPVQQPYRPPQPPQQQPFFPQQPHRPPNVTHPSPQHLPPAKRQRFDNSHPQQNPPQPRFQPPPPPPMPQSVPHGPNRPPGPPGPMVGGAANQMQGGSFSGGGGRGGAMGGMGGVGRGGGGGSGGMGRGRGGSMGGNRGVGMNRGGGRGGGMYGGGGRGGSGGQPGGPLRGHQSRDRGSFNNNYNRRGGGGSFSGHHQNNSSFRGGHGRTNGQPHSGHGRGGRPDGHQNRPMNNPSVGGAGSNVKKDENRRTLTDFKLVGLEIQNLDWRWGTTPYTAMADAPIDSIVAEVRTETATPDVTDPAKPEDTDDDLVVSTATDEPSSKIESSSASAQNDALSVANVTASSDTLNQANSAPPSRMRIYFHTPPSPDDSRPIPQTSSFTTPTDSRKGKRKKLEDDDGDIEEGRVPPPRPVLGGNSSVGSADGMDGHSTVADGAGRDSVAPSVAETASEADWLMAAITDGADGADDVLEATQIDEQDHGHNHEGGDHEQDQSYAEAVHDGDMDGEGDVDDNMSDADTQPDELLVTVENGDEHEKHTVPADAGSAQEHAANNSADGRADVSRRDDGGESTPAAASKTADGSKPASASASAPQTSDLTSTLDSNPAQTSSDNKITAGNGEGGALAPTSAANPENLQTLLSSLSHVLETKGDQKSSSPHVHGVFPTIIPNGAGLPEKPVTDGEHEHLPEPPASPGSNTLPSSSSTESTHADGVVSTSKGVPGARVPSANRLSISYAGGTRRLVIDADIVENLKVFRGDGRIEVAMTVERAADGFKGILIEALNESTKSYTPLTDLSEANESDETLPPFWCFVFPTKTTLIVYLDTERPLSEPKWVKTGDVQDWLKSMFGRMFWVTGDAVGWEKKIEVVDPDPAPTIQSVLEGWSTNSPVGSLTERQRFLKTHMSEADNILEILLRLVRGERATPFSQNSSAISSPSIAGPLLAALSPSSAHSSQQTHVSLAVLAIVRIAVEYAESALGNEKGKGQVDERVGEIIRYLPSHLLYKSLDGIFKEWRVDKKGGR
ncbi:hypothetical protein BD410DRAFT_780271 [Rickenella mellea]|uniref:Uncharacterized protein n=1 Tax=Rickenella mellea TaxID=50990 RepID=A0A4R5XF90_9AGAM|nr:hypothetical protein BD410DRAFT_780271 [Rickenella mellea]